MMALDSNLLYQFVRDALAPYSEDFRLLDRQNPAQFRLNGVIYSAHVSYVHDSGNARDNDDEVRIQIGRPLIEVQRSRAASGSRVAFLGFIETGKVFVAWDPRHIFSLQAKSIVSVYARQSQLTSVETGQVGVHIFDAKLLREQSLAIALSANALGLYLENVGRFHQLGSAEAIKQVLSKTLDATTETGLGAVGEYVAETDRRRERFEYTRTAYPRDPRFAKDVMSAYERTCCVCGRQLSLVQAAHIVPHSEADSPNSVRNGLALCIEHHQLYDDGLLLPGPDRKLVFNEDRATYLIQTGQAKGLSDVKNLSNSRYHVPDDPKKQPAKEYLEKGIRIRLGG